MLYVIYIISCFAVIAVAFAASDRTAVTVAIAITPLDCCQGAYRQ